DLGLPIDVVALDLVGTDLGRSFDELLDLLGEQLAALLLLEFLDGRMQKERAEHLLELLVVVAVLVNRDEPVILGDVARHAQDQTPAVLDPVFDCLVAYVKPQAFALLRQKLAPDEQLHNKLAGAARPALVGGYRVVPEQLKGVRELLLGYLCASNSGSIALRE